MKERYTRNIPTISEAEQLRLNESSVLVIGCGGLGGYAIEYLARLGVGHITAVDGDTFCESNLNRQLLSGADTLGQAKAQVAATRVHSINPEIEVCAVDEFLTRESASSLVNEVDLVIDALDNVDSRLILEDVCEEANVTLIHGAVRGWNLQAAVILPGSRVLHSLYKGGESDDKESKSCLCPTVACCASIQAAEAVKSLLGRESSLTENVLFMDLNTMESYTVPIK